jgi:hypothetical protein
VIWTLVEFVVLQFLLICEVCIEEQQIKVVFRNNSERQTNKPLEIVKPNVFGRIRDIMFIDDS